MGFDLHRALDGMRGRGRLLVLTHDNPDPDAMAAAFGLERVMARAGIASTLAFGGIIGRAENRAMVRELAIPLTPIEHLDPSQFDAIALLDTQPQTGNNSLPDGRRADIVIDHHPIRAESLSASWCDIRETGGTSLIVHGYFKELGIPLDERVATAFFYALKSETRDLSREAGEHERAAYLELLPQADPRRLQAITNPKLGREHFVAVDRALRAATLRGELLTVNVGELPYPDLVAEAADLLLPLDGVHWVLCVGQHDHVVYLSLRTDRADAGAGRLMRTLLGKSGAGGGHGQIAGGRLFDPVDGDGELQSVCDELVGRLAAELGVSAAPSPLL